LLVGLLGLAGIILVSPWEWFSSLFFFRNYVPPSMIHQGWGGYTIHYWSLAVEEHFYLLWPALLVFAGRVRARYVAGGLAILISIWRAWDVHHRWVDRRIPGLLFGSRTDVRLDGLLLGCLAALLLADPAWRSWASRKLKLPFWWTCVIAYVLFQALSRRHNYTIWESLLLSAIVATTMLQPGTWVGRLLEQPLMRWIGAMSYSLYVWQQFFLLPQATYPLSLLQSFPLNVVLLFLFAFLSYRFVEKPMIRLGHRLAPPPTPGRQDLEPGISARQFSVPDSATGLKGSAA
jgi:peptidoglycan/LPS O-acetylase OafA/YrhL